MAGVRLESVGKRYGKTMAVADVDLEIHDHELLVLLGPSGCGKSTTLRLIAGLEELSSGRIYIGERDVSQLPPKDRDVAMVFQNYALYPHMNVEQNMSFGLRMRKTPRQEIQRRVQQAADVLGIAHLLRRRPAQLSGGERQRVAVGRAIVRDPAVFLFDEPLSNLDAKLRVTMRSELSQLQQRLQTTTIYVTHDQVDAMMMGHRIVVMQDGRVQQVGPPLQVYQQPASRFVAEFIGSPPMNFMDARLISSAGIPQLRCAVGDITLSSELQEPLARLDEQSVTIGIRPEDLLIEQLDQHSQLSTFAARIEAAHSLGHETIVELSAGEPPQRLLLRSSTRQLEAGTSLRVALPADKLHVFDAVTGRSLRNGSA